MSADAPSRVGVVVVTYNALPYVRKCLESVREHEVVVVDHGSSDGTVDAIREQFPEVVLLQRENRGFAAGVNAGVEATRGEWVLLLNPDAWVMPGCIEALGSHAEAHPEIAAVGPRLRYPDGSDQGSMRGFPTVWRLLTQYWFLGRLGPQTRALNAFYAGDRSESDVNDVEFLKGACMLIRREALETVGPFDESFFMFCEEADWCLRARADERGWTIHYVPAAEAVHVGEATTKSVWSAARAFREQERSHLRFLLKHQGPRAAQAARAVIGVGYLLRAVIGPRAKRPAYRRTARWLFSNSLPRLLTPDA